MNIVTFIWAVINNWAGYMTGGLIMAALALWSVWKDKPVHKNLMLGLAVAFLLMAFYKAWAEQYHRAENLEKKLALVEPHLTMETAEIQPIAMAESKEVVAHLLLLKIVNINEHAASDVHGHLILIDHEFKQEPYQVTRIERLNETVHNGFFFITSNPLGEWATSRAFIYCELAYRDSVTGKEGFHKAWYLKFGEPYKGRYILQNLMDVSMEEKNRMAEYVRARGIPVPESN